MPRAVTIDRDRPIGIEIADLTRARARAESSRCNDSHPQLPPPVAHTRVKSFPKAQSTQLEKHRSSQISVRQSREVGVELSRKERQLYLADNTSPCVRVCNLRRPDRTRGNAHVFTGEGLFTASSLPTQTQRRHPREFRLIGAIKVTLVYPSRHYTSLSLNHVVNDAPPAAARK